MTHIFGTVFGTIPSIPTPLANFGIELTLYSNSTLGIVASTPIPTQRNWGDSTESELELKLQFHVWNWNGGSIQFQNSPMELELELTELFQTLLSVL